MTWPTTAAAPAQLALAFNLSWAVNILLFVVKLYAYLVSHSKAVLVRRNLSHMFETHPDVVHASWLTFCSSCCLKS